MSSRKTPHKHPLKPYYLDSQVPDSPLVVVKNGKATLNHPPTPTKKVIKKKKDNKITKPIPIQKLVGKETEALKKRKARKKAAEETPATQAKKGGTMKRKAGGTIKKQVGGLPQGYNARLDESLAARHPAVRGNLAARRAESEGMERALGRGPYSGARTMAKKGGSVSRKKGGTTSRKGGGKIMQGYKAGGKV